LTAIVFSLSLLSRSLPQTLAEAGGGGRGTLAATVDAEP